MLCSWGKDSGRRIKREWERERFAKTQFYFFAENKARAFFPGTSLVCVREFFFLSFVCDMTARGIKTK
uniref:Uncharacterized protein n=1 Tax=Lepeophtheirus salmonis TaxID=72036 RepID=A0A0K2UW78_LEPSM